MLSLNSMAKKNLHPEANVFVNFIYQNKSKKFGGHKHHKKELIK
jgi:hypothetical protein